MRPENKNCRDCFFYFNDDKGCTHFDKFNCLDSTTHPYYRDIIKNLDKKEKKMEPIQIIKLPSFEHEIKVYSRNKIVIGCEEHNLYNWKNHDAIILDKYNVPDWKIMILDGVFKMLDEILPKEPEWEEIIIEGEHEIRCIKHNAVKMYRLIVELAKMADKYVNDNKLNQTSYQARARQICIEITKELREQREGLKE